MRPRRCRRPTRLPWQECRSRPFSAGRGNSHAYCDLPSGNGLPPSSLARTPDGSVPPFPPARSSGDGFPSVPLVRRRTSSRSAGLAYRPRSPCSVATWRANVVKRRAPPQVTLPLAPAAPPPARCARSTPRAATSRTRNGGRSREGDERERAGITPNPLAFAFRTCARLSMHSKTAWPRLL